MTKDDDTDYEEYAIQKTELDRRRQPHMWNCELEFGLRVSFERRGGFQPRQGMTVRIYGQAPDDIRGLDLDGKELFYFTPEEWTAEVEGVQAQWLATYTALYREHQALYHEVAESLPGPYQDRLVRIEEGDEHGEHLEAMFVREILVSEQAHMMARVFRAQEEVENPIDGLKHEVTEADFDTLASLPTFQKMRQSLGYMAQDADYEGAELATEHSRATLRATFALARMEFLSDEEGIAAFPALQESSRDRLLQLLDCPFPELLEIA